MPCSQEHSTMQLNNAQQFAVYQEQLKFQRDVQFAQLKHVQALQMQQDLERRKLANAAFQQAGNALAQGVQAGTAIANARNQMLGHRIAIYNANLQARNHQLQRQHEFQKMKLAQRHERERWEHERREKRAQWAREDKLKREQRQHELALERAKHEPQPRLQLRQILETAKKRPFKGQVTKVIQSVKLLDQKASAELNNYLIDVRDGLILLMTQVYNVPQASVQTEFPNSQSFFHTCSDFWVACRQNRPAKQKDEFLRICRRLGEVFSKYEPILFSLKNIRSLDPQTHRFTADELKNFEIFDMKSKHHCKVASAKICINQAEASQKDAFSWEIVVRLSDKRVYQQSLQVCFASHGINISHKLPAENYATLVSCVRWRELSFRKTKTLIQLAFTFSRAKFFPVQCQ